MRGIQPKEAPEEKKAPAQEPQTPLPQGNTHNPETIKKLMDDAKSVQGALNDRYEAIDKH